MNFPKLLIIGEAGHGKDELMHYLADHYGYQGWSSSYYAAHHFMHERMLARTGITYNSVDECYADRRCAAHRQIWFEEIERFNTPDKTRMATGMLAERPIYNGMRSDKEFYSCKAAKVFDCVLYLDATARLTRNGTYTPDSTLKIPKSEADIVMYNNDSLKDLAQRADNLMALMRIPRLT